MFIKTHCEDCKAILNNEYGHIHEFLDQYAAIFQVSVFLEYHRTFLHNKVGLEIIRSRWGGKAYLAGIVHIARDYNETGMDNKDMEWILKNFGKALLYFNNMDNFNPGIDPRIVHGWGKDSLCYIAFGNNGYDQYYRSLKDL